MKETKFIDQNKRKWHEFEQLNAKNTTDPDKLSELFVQMTEDLSYARTFYPKRSVKVYLNFLAQKVYNSFNNKKSARTNKIAYLTTEQIIIAAVLFLAGFFLGFLAGFSLGIISKVFIGLLAGSFFSFPVFIPRLRDFFFRSLPLELYRSRKQLLTAFLFFGGAVLIGVVSSAIDPDFSRVILGDSYVDMTLDNIDQEDPMAVYKQQKETSMFLGITLNNIMVAFYAFILGLFFSVGTVFLLVSNGVMLGAFQYFFKIKGLFLTSFLTIWIHGALEISAIVIAGCAGMVMGNGILFPKTLTRAQSFQIHARRGLKILFGTIPLFIVAGFLEGFVTRHTEMADLSKWSIIIGSFSFILFYFVVYPIMVARRTNFDEQLVEKPVFQPTQEVKKYGIRDLGAIFYDTFNFYRQYFKNFGGIILKIILPLQLVFLIVYYLYSEYGGYFMPDNQNMFHALAMGRDFNWVGFVSNTLLFSLSIATVYHSLNGVGDTIKQSYLKSWFTQIWAYLIKTIPLVAGTLLAINFLLIPFFDLFDTFQLLLLIILVPLLAFVFVPFIVPLFAGVNLISFGKGLNKGVKYGTKKWGQTFVIFLMIGGLCTLFYFFLLVPVWFFLDEIVNWHTVTVFENYILVQNIIKAFILTSFVHLLLPLFFASFGLQFFSMKDEEEAIELNNRLADFGKSSKIYEEQ